MTKWELLGLLISAATGNHLEHRSVTIVRVKAFSIIPEDDKQVDVDGEGYPMEPFTAEVLPSFLRVIMPKYRTNEPKSTK